MCENKKLCIKYDIATFAEFIPLKDDISTVKETEVTKYLLNINYVSDVHNIDIIKCTTIHKGETEILVVHYVSDTESLINTFKDKSLKPCNCNKENNIHYFHGSIVISKWKDKKQIDITIQDVYADLFP